MNARTQEAVQRMKSALFSETNKEFLIFIGFLGISAFFWVLQSLDGEYEYVMNVPVEYRNVPTDVVITSDPPDTLQITVKDNGFSMLNYRFRRNLKPVVFDFNAYEGKGTDLHVASSDLVKQLEDNFSSQSELISIKPDNFEVVYTRGKGKKVPVLIAGDLKTKLQYEVTGTTATPDSVLVYAPQEILDTLQGLYTRSIIYSNLDKSLTTETMLRSLNNVKAIPSKVKVDISVEQLTEKTLEVPVYAINVPEGKTLRTFPSKVKVTFQTVLSYYKTVTANNFIIQIDYNEIMNTEATHAVPTVLAPSIIKHMRISPKEVDFLLEDAEPQP